MSDSKSNHNEFLKEALDKKDEKYDFHPTHDITPVDPYRTPGILSSHNDLLQEAFDKKIKERTASNEEAAVKALSNSILKHEDERILNKLKSFAEETKDKPLASEDELNFIKNLTSSYTNNLCWLNTFSGKKIYPLNPSPEDICIEDIAHSLSHQCRFTGHTKDFYSIAQHCVLVSYVCNHENALYGLLHDASEYILVDIPSPLKKSKEFNFYRDIERKVQAIIYNKFGLYDEEPVDVKKADALLLATEARDLLNSIHPDWTMKTEPLPFKIEALGPKEAEKLFLNRFFALNLISSIK